MQPKRVAIVVPWDFNEGGVSNVVASLVRAPTELFSIGLIVMPGESIFPREIETGYGIQGAEISLRNQPASSSGLLRRSRYLLARIPTARSLGKLLVRHSIDIVNVHYPCFGLGIIRDATRELGVPIVASIHGADLFPGGRRLQSGFAEVSRFLEQADRVVGPSHGFAAEVGSVWGSVGSRLHVIHNAIDYELFDCPQRVARESDSLTIVCVAIHNEKKALDTLLHAVCLVRQRSMLDVRVQLAGDGPLRARL